MKEIRYFGDEFGVRWDRDVADHKGIDRIVKGILHRTYDRSGDYYTVAPMPEAIWGLRRLINEFGFTPSGTALAEVRFYEEQAEMMVRASRATDAEIDAPGIPLYPYQRAGVDYALRAKRTFIADKMGLGKTLQALTAMEVADAYPAIVISPGYLKLNWHREVRTWLPHRSVEVLHSSSLGEYSADITIANYDLLTTGWVGGEELRNVQALIREQMLLKEAGAAIDEKRLRRLRKQEKMLREDVRAAQRSLDIVLSDHARYLGEIGTPCISADEFHYCKSEGSQRSQGMYFLTSTQPEDSYFFGLTGTPTKNGRNIEYAAQLDIMGRLDEVFGGYYKFAYRYTKVRRDGRRTHFEKAKNSHELNERMRAFCYIRRLTEDVVDDLPEKRFGDVPLTLTNLDEYRFARDEILEWYREKVQEDEEFLGSIAHLSGPEQEQAITKRGNQAVSRARQSQMMIRMNALKRLSGQGKVQGSIQWIKGFLEDQDEEEKLIVVVWHRDVAKDIAEAVGAPYIIGGMNPKKVEENKRRFQEERDPRVIVVNIESGGVGHTLTAAHHMLMVEYPWTPGDMDQAIYRAYARINDMHGLMIWRTIGVESFDDSLLAILASKRGRADASMDGEGSDDDGEGVVQEVLDSILSG